MKLKLKRLNDKAILPSQETVGAAGYDLYAAETKIISPGTNEKIGTGWAMEIPEGYFGGIFARSGLSTKQGLRPANCVGVVDDDYRGEVMVALYNDSDKPRTVQTGDRIAQMVIIRKESVTLEETDTLSDTVRGNGGFGHTGK